MFVQAGAAASAAAPGFHFAIGGRTVARRNRLTLESIPAFTIPLVIAVNNNRAFSSGELASLAGVSSDTLRHYERKGVLTRPRRSSNGYRQYPAEALQRVQLVRRALSVGFTLDELSTILKIRDQGGAPCQEVRTLAAQKLSNIESQLRDLTRLRDELRTTLRDWDARLARRTEGERVGLLESLAANRNATNSLGHVSSSLKQKHTREKK